MLLKLAENKIDINQLCVDIQNLPIDKKVGLSDLYSKWDELNDTESRQVGKVFKDLVEAKVINSLSVEVSASNSATYCKV